MQNNAIYILKKVKEINFEILTNGKKHKFFFVLLKKLFNY
jgi:hypothetical protein